MTIVQLQLSPWDKICSLVDKLNCKPYDHVVVKSEFGLDLAQVIDVFEAEVYAPLDEDIELIRMATIDDLQTVMTEKEKQTVMQTCHALAKTANLPMKLVDLRSSLDGTRLTFAFVANGRIDFRDLVKELTKVFNKTIRLQQIGIRDEAKLLGDHGRCGLGLCCKGHIQKFFSVTGDMAEVQNLANRGSDRLSGSCGRLMCCLAYEAEGYKEALDKMPAVGAKVNVDGKKGTVVSRQALKNSVNVKFPGEKGENDFVVEVDLDRNKKK